MLVRDYDAARWHVVRCISSWLLCVVLHYGRWRCVVVCVGRVLGACYIAAIGSVCCSLAASVATACCVACAACNIAPCSGVRHMKLSYIAYIQQCHSIVARRGGWRVCV